MPKAAKSNAKALSRIEKIRQMEMKKLPLLGRFFCFKTFFKICFICVPIF